MNNKLTNVIILFFFISCFAACKKDHQNSAAANHTITGITRIESFGTTTYTIAYNKDSSVNTIKISGVLSGSQVNNTAEFSYLPNTILIKKTDLVNTGFNTLDSITLNPSGRITNVRTYNEAKTNWVNEQYDLNAGNEITLQTEGNSTSSKTAKFAYTYLNGNLTVASYGSFAYDLSKPAMVGDYHSIMTLISFGLKYNLSKNLVSGQVFGNSPETFYNYTYDQKGRIITCALVQQGQTSTQYKLTYSD